MFRPSRNQVLFGTATVGVASWFYYDRTKTSEILNHYKERASSEIAAVPIKTVLEQPRRLNVYFGATFPKSQSDSKEYSDQETAAAHRDMNEMKWCFDQYAKPVLDAAALNYSVNASVQSLPDLRSEVRKKLQDAECGHVAFGRVAFKALVMEVTKVEPKVVSEDQLDNRWFYVRWFSQKLPQKHTTVPYEVGYIAHTAPSNSDTGGDNWYNRYPKKFYSFCNRRHLAHRISEAAFTVAAGETVPMSHAVPGDMVFQISDEENVVVEESQTEKV